MDKNITTNLKAKDVAVIDVFSGPGGLSLGLQEAGFNIMAAVESDKYAAQTYTTNLPNVRLLNKKIEDIHGNELLDILARETYSKYLLVGGPPCQPYSTANLQNNGSKHPLVSTIDHFVRLIEESKPDAFFFENVMNFQRIHNGESINRMIRKLNELGYGISIAQLKAEAFGVPQFRRRLHLGGIKGNNAEPYDLNNLANKKNKKLTTVGDAISDLPPLSDGGGGFDEMDYMSVEQLSTYQKRARLKSGKLYNHWCSKNSQEVVNTISHILPGSSLMKQWSSLPESTKKRYKVQSNIHSNIYKRLSLPQQSPTVVHARRAMLLHPLTNRIITVREAARLQSFPDCFRFYGPLNNQYQQVANAVPPLVAKALGNFYYKFVGEQKNGNK